MLPGTMRTVGGWICQNCKATFLIPAENAIASIGSGSFANSGLSGKVVLNGTVTFGANNSGIGNFEGSKIQAVEFGKDITTYPWGTFKSCRSLTNYTSKAITHTITAWSLQNCTALKEYHFACYPTLNSNWNNGAKTRTGVRTFVPRGNPGWKEQMQAGTFKAWSNCSTAEKDAYFAAFGADAEVPKGYTTLPYATWLLTYDLNASFMLFLR